MHSTAGSTTGNTVRRNLVVLAGGQATTWTMTLLWTLIVPRVLGPAGLGLITAVWAATAIMSVLLGLGTTNYLGRELVAQPDSNGSLVGTALVLRVVMVPVFIATALTFAHFAHYGHDARLVLWLATGATLFTLLDEPILVGFQAKERMQYMAYSDVINKSAQGLVGIVIVLIGFGAVGLTASWLVVSILVFLLGIRWIKPLVDIDLRTSVRQLVAARAGQRGVLRVRRVLPDLSVDRFGDALAHDKQRGRGMVRGTDQAARNLRVPSGDHHERVGTAIWCGPSKPLLTKLAETARPPIELVLVLSLPLCAASALAATAAHPPSVRQRVPEIRARHGDPRIHPHPHVRQHRLRPGARRHAPSRCVSPCSWPGPL